MNSSIRCLLLAGTAVAFTQTAQARIERVVEKEFTVAGPGTLRVETSGGGVRVVAGSDTVVRVKAKQRIRANSEAEADELLKKLDLTIEQQGNDVQAVAKYERRGSGVFVWVVAAGAG